MRQSGSSSQWPISTTTGGGILKKRQYNNDKRGRIINTNDDRIHNDLLIFGYSCRLFDNCEKAEWLAEERHLIPWHNDASLTIDR